jgi:hypothetical protein
MQNIFHIQVVEGSKEEKVVQTRKENETFSQVQLRGLKLSIHFPNGQTQFGKLISYHVIKTGLFLWEYVMVPPHLIDAPNYTSSVIEQWANCFIGLSDDQIVIFSLQDVFLWVKDSDERYKTFEEAYEKSIIPILTKNAKRIEEGNYHEEYRKIQLSDCMDDDFFFLSFTQRCVAKITEVTRQNGSWKISMTGAPPPRARSDKNWGFPPPYDPNGSNNRKAILILSDDYEVLEVLEVKGEPGTLD